MLIKHVDTIVPESFIKYRDDLKRDIHTEVKLQYNTLSQLEIIEINKYNQNDDNDFDEFLWSFYSIQKIYDHQGYFTKVKEINGTYTLYLSLIPI
jgi:hypothetical protein